MSDPNGVSADRYPGVMRCPYCGEEDTRVVDSRPAEGGVAIRRRRSCETCGQRFTTYERRQPVVMVRKRDGRLQPFDAAKVRAGISQAMAGGDTPSELVDAAVVRIEAFAEEAGPEVTSEDIGHRVLDELRDIDEVAYLRFASVYKGFVGASDFSREVESLEEPR